MPEPPNEPLADATPARVAPLRKADLVCQAKPLIQPARGETAPPAVAGIDTIKRAAIGVGFAALADR